MAEEVVQEKGKKKGVIVAVVALVAILVVAVAAYSVLPSIRASAPYELTPAAQVDSLASSSLMASSVENSEGEKITIGDISKKSQKPIVMNLWATWCPHCTTEMKDYQKLYDEYGDRIEFAMLDVVDKKSEASAARDYIKEQAFTFPVYYDSDAEVRNALSVVGIPMSVIVSADGDVVLARSGEINYSAMKSTIEKVLNA